MYSETIGFCLFPRKSHNIGEHNTIVLYHKLSFTECFFPQNYHRLL